MEASELADDLEAYASSRADFRQLSPDERERVARELVIARAQARNSGDHERGSYYWDQLIRKRSQFFHVCGKFGIDYSEGRLMWWNFVWDDPAPADRSDLV